MRDFFRYDGGFFRALSKLGDIITASALWFVFSLPLVTIGASTTALYYACVKSIRYERGYVWKSFWKAFKENLFSSTVFWLIMLVAAIVMWINFRFAFSLDSVGGLLLQGLYVFMAIFLLLTSVYVFPVQSRFFLKRWQVLKYSFLMGVKHLPFSVAIVAILAVAVIAVLFLPPLVFVMPAGAALFISVPMERILKKYTPASTDENADTWYLE